MTNEIENPFEPEEAKPKRPKRKKVVFVVTEPSEKNKYPAVLDHFDKKEDVLLLHNRFDYNNAVGQKTLLQLKKKDLPTSKHMWEQLMRQEFWGIKQAELVVFDLDNLSSFHLMSAAAIYDKPIICVSDTLKPVPAYFSGSVLGVFKIEDIDVFLKSFKKKKKPRKQVAKTKTEEDAGPEAAEPDMKTKLQGMLHKSLVQHLAPNGLSNE